MVLPIYGQKIWLWITAGVVGLSLVGVLAFFLLRHGGLLPDLFPTPVIVPAAKALQEPASVKVKALNADKEQNEQMEQLQHQLVELTKQVSALNSRAKRPRKRSRVASLVRKRSKSRTARVPGIKKKSADKQAKVRVRYDHKQNVVEVWLPKGNADVRVKREGDDRHSGDNKEIKPAKGALR
jgi:hypothetical protein